MVRRKADTRDRMRCRVEKLSTGFQHYLDIFSEKNHFSGPSTYFHEKTLRLLRDAGSIRKFSEDESCVDSLYATLTAWGLHRMGKNGSKLVEHDIFQDSLKRFAPMLDELRDVRLLDIDRERASVIGERLSGLINTIKISNTGTQLVAGSKTLHHLLPGLVPPIDRNYTLRFFYSEFRERSEKQPQVPIPTGGDGSVFREVFTQFHSLGEVNKDVVRRSVGKQFFTSESKVIDNAIMGYVLDKIGPVDEE